VGTVAPVMLKRTWSEVDAWAAAGVIPVAASSTNAVPKQAVLIPPLRIAIFIVISSILRSCLIN
jgi:hypothetical protein